MKSNINLQSNNVKHREKTTSAVLFDVRTLILTLVLTLTMVMGSAFNVSNFAYAAVTESEANGVPILKDGKTAYVATFKQLEAVLSMGSNYDNIVIDPQAAKVLTDVDVPDGESGDVVYGGGPFYIPIDRPLAVIGDVTISSASGVEVVFARAANGGNGTYDSGTFEGQNENTPALFNVDSGKKLTLNGNITMTGEEVSATFNKGQEYKPATTAPLLLGSSGLYLAGDPNKATLAGTGGHEFVLNNDGLVTYTDADGITTRYFVADGTKGSYKYFNTPPSSTTQSKYVRVLDYDDLDGGFVTELLPNHTYVLWDGYYPPGGYITKKSNSNDFDNPNPDPEADNVIKFVASAKENTDTTDTEGQEYIAPSFAFTTSSKEWDYGAEPGNVIDGGYFIHTKGGKVELNSGVTLTQLHTASDARNVAPVYVGGQGGNLKINGASITDNVVGYSGGDESKSSLMVKDYNAADIEEFVEGTPMTNSAGAVILDNNATATFTSGHLNGNRADVGAVLVKDGAELDMSGTREGTTINNNVGFHHAGAVQVESGGKVRMTGGTMDGNVAWYKGGAVWATEWGTNNYADLNWNTKPFPTLRNPGDRKEGGYFSMDGGWLTNNTAFKRAGAIEVESNNVYLKSGEISGNVTRSLGGAIYVEGDNTTYTYTLLIENGYIGNNYAVKPGTGGDINNKINRYLDGTGNLTEASASNPSSHDHDFSYWGAAGNGGGVWLCPRGGTASFTGQNVIIDNNKKERNGTDLFLQPGYGSVMLQDMKGTWYKEGTPKTVIQTNGIYNGPLPLVNGGDGKDFAETSSSTGIVIKDNYARDGGGIAANGTVIFGNPADEFRYDARVNIHKTWNNVPASERENINIQVGYGNPRDDNDFTILDTTLIKGTEDNSADPTPVELTLDGTSGTIGNLSDAVAGETSGGVNANEWKGYVTIPSVVNGEAMYLFDKPSVNQLSGIAQYFTTEEIAAYSLPTKTSLDPSKPSDLKYLYYISKHYPNLLTVKEGSSKIKIRETNTKYDKVYDLDLRVETVDHSGRETVLIEPASGAVHGRFTTYFTSMQLRVGVSNSIKKVSTSFTKVATDSTNAKKWIKNAKFIVVEMSLDKSGDFRVAGNPGSWNDYDASLTILDVAEKDENGNMAVFTSGVGGQVTINNLRAGKTYFMFEYEPQTGYVSTSSPWIIAVDSNGNSPSILAIDPEAKYGQQSAINKVKTNRPKNNEKLEDFVVNDSTNTKNLVWHAYWPKSWYYNGNTPINPVTNGEIGNATADIKITKVDDDGEPIKEAVFAFADVGWESNSNYTKVFFSEAGVVRKDGKYLTVTSDATGNIDLAPVINALDPSSNGNAGQGRMDPESIWLMMFELEVSDDYAQKTAPWLVNIEKDGSVKIYEYKNPYIYESSPIKKNASGNWEWDNAVVNGNSSKQVRNIPIADYSISDNPSNDRPVGQSDGDNNAQVENVKALKLTKVDGITGQTVLGTKFRLYKADQDVTFDDNGDLATGGQIAVQSVDKYTDIDAADGTLNLGALRAGTYLLFETQAASGYERRKEPWLIHVNEDGTYRMAIYDHDYLSFYGEKDGQTKWYARSIDADALAGWNNIKNNLGNIKYYLKSENTVRFTELDGENEKGKLKNKPMDLKIVKKSSATNQILSGVEFDLYNASREKVTVNEKDHFEYQVNGNKINNSGDIVSGADGSFTLPTLEPNHIYMLFEKEPPSGYEKPSTPWGILVDGDGVVTVWRLKKSGDDGYDATSVARYSADTPPSQVNIICTDLIKTGSHEITNDRKPIELTKVDEEGVAITGSSAQFVITKTENDGTGWFIKEGRNHPGSTLTSASSSPNAFGGSGKTVTSDSATGKITISDLAHGDYLLFETSSPAGFRRATAPWLIQVRETANGRTWNVFALKSDYVDKALVGENNPTMQVIAENDQSAYKRWWPDSWFEKQNVQNIENEPKYVTKVDKDNTSTVLEGAEFELYEAYVESIYYNDPNGDKWIRRVNGKIGDTIVSDSKGRIELPSSITRTATTEKKDPKFRGDRYGYLLFETKAPAGYKPASNPWWITVESNGNITVKYATRNKEMTDQGYDWWKTSYFANANGLVKNTPNETTLTKVNGYNHNEKLAGAVFNVYKAKTVKVSANNSSGYDYEYQIDEFISTTQPTGSDGKIVLPSMDKGDYFLEEITAPEGFEKSDKLWIVEIIPYDYYSPTRYDVKAYVADEIPGREGWYDVDASTCQGEDFLENYPSTNLKKIDVDSVDPTTDDDGREILTAGEDGEVFLSGVKFKLYESKEDKWEKKTNNPVHVSETNTTGEIVTDDNGILELGTLKPNTKYLLYEVEAKEGYILPTVPWRIKTGSDGKLEKLWVPADSEGSEYTETAHMTYLTNTKVYNLPSAGGMGTYWFMIIGAMMMGFALTAAITKMDILKLFRR